MELPPLKTVLSSPDSDSDGYFLTTKDDDVVSPVQRDNTYLSSGFSVASGLVVSARVTPESYLKTVNIKFDESKALWLMLAAGVQHCVFPVTAVSQVFVSYDCINSEVREQARVLQKLGSSVLLTLVATSVYSSLKPPSVYQAIVSTHLSGISVSRIFDALGVKLACVYRSLELDGTDKFYITVLERIVGFLYINFGLDKVFTFVKYIRRCAHSTWLDASAAL